MTTIYNWCHNTAMPLKGYLTNKKSSPLSRYGYVLATSFS